MGGQFEYIYILMHDSQTLGFPNDADKQLVFSKHNWTAIVLVHVKSVVSPNLNLWQQ